MSRNQQIIQGTKGADKPAKNLFWLLTIGAWTGFVAINTLLRGPIVGEVVLTLVVNISFAVVGVLLTHLIVSMIVEKPREGRSFRWGQVLILIGVSSLGLAFLDVKIFFALSGLTLMTIDNSNYFAAAFVYGVVFSSLCFFFVGLSALTGNFEARIVAEQLAQKASELKALRYQLTPHFLYNTLNATSALILDQESEKADRIVEYLSRFLRFCLDVDFDSQVSLSKEIEILDLYLEIEHVRFDQRLKVSVELDEDIKNCLVPSLLLQPLVENAIHHAIVPCEGGGTIRITGRGTDLGLEIVVEDTGPGLAAKQSVEQLVASAKGVGLRNTSQRLEHFYGPAAKLSFEAAQPHGLRVIMQLPRRVAPGQTTDFVVTAGSGHRIIEGAAAKEVD
jgi:two-component system, LytTR family, sensor kinase